MPDYDFDDARFIRRPRRVVACSDGYCGAWDCPRCHGENFDPDMNYVGDDEDDDPAATPRGKDAT